jgi:hypothetical protein
LRCVHELQPRVKIILCPVVRSIIMSFLSQSSPKKCRGFFQPPGFFSGIVINYLMR